MTDARTVAYRPQNLVMMLVVHLLLGFRRLRERDFYRDDPIVQRVLGLQRLPDVSTWTRGLAEMTPSNIEGLRALNRELVIDRLREEQIRRVTIDFDDSVLSTRGHAEGTAIGFNRKRKGARSYYPLFSTIAQTPASSSISFIAPATFTTRATLSRSSRPTSRSCARSLVFGRSKPEWTERSSPRTLPRSSST